MSAFLDGLIVTAGVGWLLYGVGELIYLRRRTRISGQSDRDASIRRRAILAIAGATAALLLVSSQLWL